VSPDGRAADEIAVTCAVDHPALIKVVGSIAEPHALVVVRVSDARTRPASGWSVSALAKGVTVHICAGRPWLLFPRAQQGRVVVVWWFLRPQPPPHKLALSGLATPCGTGRKKVCQTFWQKADRRSSALSMSLVCHPHHS